MDSSDTATPIELPVNLKYVDVRETAESACRNKELLEDKRDLVLMPFIAGDEDPDDPDLEPDHWGKLLDEAYSLVFVQRLTHVNRVSEVLERTGYYDKLGPEFLQYVKERRGL